MQRDILIAVAIIGLLMLALFFAREAETALLKQALTGRSYK